MSIYCFLKIITLSDLAESVSLSRSELLELIQRDEQELYRSFKLKKKRGGYRLLQAPEPALKNAQRRINRYLEAELTEDIHNKAHGFVKKRSIVSNAQNHVGKAWVLNFDLEDFFGSFTRSAVLNLFLQPPFSFDQPVAEQLTNLCTTKQGLPQGAPSSPILSNLLSNRLDQQLSDFARQHHLSYTRYADDISFSSNHSIPAGLLSKDPETSAWKLGATITNMVKDCGFGINHRKTRLQTRHQRQEVTGLIVNEQLNVDRRYVRNLRAMIHAYKVYGFLAAFKFVNHYASKETEHKSPLASFLATIQGRISFVAMVKGNDHQVVIKLRQDFEQAKAERLKFTLLINDVHDQSAN
ncbi:MAG TPA: reverse transcriptase domain-containing protein [Thiotrichales bacterium]|nr:reverse transcriptase domain-containing protein [Thiotrichales bacterium]